MFKPFLITHQIVVTIFFLIYVIKTVLLLSNKQDVLAKFTKISKVPEMIVSTLFLVTGVYLLTQLPVIKPMMWVKITMVLASIPVAVIGFKKGNKILASLSLLMITASYGLAEMSRKQNLSVSTEQTTSLDGKVLYEANCASCHGNDGKLGMAGAMDISKTALDPSGIKNIVQNGRGVMPAASVTEEQAHAIAEYVHSSIKGK